MSGERYCGWWEVLGAVCVVVGCGDGRGEGSGTFGYDGVGCDGRKTEMGPTGAHNGKDVH